MKLPQSRPAALLPIAAALAAGMAASATLPASAATRTEKSFGSWNVICIQQDDNAPKHCTLLQQLVQSDNKVVLVWSINSGDKSELTQAVTVPAGVSVKEGVRLFIGDAEPLTMAYDICGARVCVAKASLDDKLVGIMKASQKASASYVQMSKQLLQVNLELSGFADAYEFFLKQLSDGRQMAPPSTDEIRNDYPPEDPLGWSRAKPGEERLNRATGFASGGRAAEKRQRRGNRSTYVAIVVLLAILVGGGYWANLRGWIDLSGIPTIPNIPGITGGGSPSPRGVDRAKLVFSGNARDLASPAGNLVQQDKADPSTTWIRSSLREAAATGATDGASLEITPPLATDLVGKRIRLTISARAPDQGSPSPFAVAYSAGNAGSSGWVVFTPSKEFDDYTFDYQVPATVDAAQHLGIWSDISGRGAPLAVRTITIEPLN